MHTRFDIGLVVVIVTSVVALFLYRRWLNKPPSIAEVYEALSWRGASVQYRRMDMRGFVGVETVQCRTKQKNGSLSFALIDGAYMRWRPKDNKLENAALSLDDARMLGEIFALARVPR